MLLCLMFLGLGTTELVEEDSVFGVVSARAVAWGVEG